MANRTPAPPPITIEADWEETVLPFNIGSGRSIYTGLEGDNRLRMRIFRRISDKRAVGKVWFGPGADGPPGHVHGGAIAYVLDEVMGSTGWMNDYPSVAAKLEFQYMRMTPLQTDLHIESWIESATERRLMLVAELRMPNGDVSVKAKGEFAILSKEKLKALASFIDDPSGVLQNPKLKWLKENS